MNRSDSIHRSGMVGMGGAGLFIIGLFIEYTYGLFPPGDGSVFYTVNQWIFFIGMLGIFVMLLGLWRARVTGDGVFGKIALGILITAESAFVIGLAISLLLDNLNQILNSISGLLLPIGGLLQLIGILLTGIAVVAAKRWEGWRRFIILTQAIYLLLAIMLPLFIANYGPTLLTESLWEVAWFLTSLALFTQPGRLQQAKLSTT